MKTFVCLVSLVACGGGPLDPGAGNDPGTGTQTLLIEGGASASPRFVNAANPNEFDTDFSVRIERAGGQAVVTGSVTVTSATGSVPLVLGPENRWRGAMANYDEVYQLDIDDGTDSARGIRVDGPDIHVFAAPLAGATVDSRVPLNLAWNREEAAQIITLRAEGIDELSITDTGSYQLAANLLRAERDKARTNDLRIRREQEVTPLGALPGSHWSVSVTNRIEVVVQANPAL